MSRTTIIGDGSHAITVEVTTSKPLYSSTVCGVVCGRIDFLLSVVSYNVVVVQSITAYRPRLSKSLSPTAEPERERQGKDGHKESCRGDTLTPP